MEREAHRRPYWAMHAASLNRLMTGQRPADSGDEQVERRFDPAPGYATFDQLLSAVHEQTRVFERGLDNLGDTLREEWRAWRHEHEEDARDRDARIAAIEARLREEELEHAARESMKKTVLRVTRWLFENWPAMLSLGATIVGIVWVIVSGGQPGIEGLP